MKPPPVITIDFETLPIQQRPEYPPKPVGVAIKWPGEAGRYYAWGHVAGGNNACEYQAKDELSAAFFSDLPILCHSAKFDIAVACEGLGLPEPPWQRVHDTMFLSYLCDPHARSTGLKPLAADLLNWPADEQDELHDWILAHKVELETTYPQYGKVTKKTAGAWIFAAPGELVGRYAIGDVERTAALFENLWPIVQREGMGAAYDRERQLMPILLANEWEGIRVDLEALDNDIRCFDTSLEYVETWLRTELHASGLNFDADQDVANVLIQSGAVDAEKFARTQSGKLSVSKETLTPDLFNDPRVASALGYRNRLKTCLSMFMEPWLAQASVNSGHITTNWNQIRGERGGTRSGRPSTNKHNFLNLSTDYDEKSDGFVHPEFLNVAHLPLVRKYCLPDEGEVWIDIDFDGQELRVFAHAEQGDLWQAYNDDPDTDPHAFVGRMAAPIKWGVEYDKALHRKPIKALNFQGIYGGGVPAIQNKLKCSNTEAREFRAAHRKALPGLDLLNDEIKRVARRGEPIRTWGGRLYYPEPPSFSKKFGKVMEWEYKLINYYCQGSGADITKQTICDWYANPQRAARFLVTVYDSICISAPIEKAREQLLLLKEEMEKPRLSVPMRASAAWGKSWGDVEAFNG